MQDEPGAARPEFPGDPTVETPPDGTVAGATMPTASFGGADDGVPDVDGGDGNSDRR
jgi:hypothetical protein